MEHGQIISGMRPWYSESGNGKNHFPSMKSGTVQERNRDQRIWDHAILASAEYVRRRLDGNEKLALEIHGLLSSSLPE